MSLHLGPARICGRCGNERPHKARGLCNPCYTSLSQRGGRDNHARINHNRADLLEDFDWLVSCGASESEAARRLGVSIKHIRRVREA